MGMFEDADEETLAAISAWRTKPAQHQPAWPDQAALDSAVEYLRSLPPLVFAGEADQLMGQMAAASRGEAFVLMGGTVRSPLRIPVRIGFGRASGRCCRWP